MTDDIFHPERGQRPGGVKVERSRELRQHMTAAERVLWDHVRGGHMLGLRFRRQQIVRGFIVDFYCHTARLVIEIDGAIHATQGDYDAERDTALRQAGLRVIRFTNDHVLHALPDVLAAITDACHTSPPTP